MKKDFTPEQYNKYVSEMSPKSKIVKDTCLAFLVGGFICLVAQVISWALKKYGVEEQTVKKAIPVIMIFIGSLLTGINVYNKVGKHAGAGTIVPITGFANSLTSAALTCLFITKSSSSTIPAASNTLAKTSMSPD